MIGPRGTQLNSGASLAQLDDEIAAELSELGGSDRKKRPMRQFDGILSPLLPTERFDATGNVPQR